MASPMNRIPIPTQRVVVMRHGERRDAAPDAPAEGDPPLTEQGKRDVEMAAHKLKRIFGPEAARNLILVVSPFSRCVQTAEALQRFGVGADMPLLYDCALCEVFGPSRIKATQAPALPAPIMDMCDGRLPKWGENIPQAHERFVTGFLRNADRFVGYGYAKASVTSDGTSSDQGPISVPAAVTTRARSTSQTNPTTHAYASRSAKLNSATATEYDVDLSHMRAGSSPRESLTQAPRDIVLVTHGDALSAILGYFYPARTLYEAAFLSFLVMKRYGRSNPVFHLDDSSGVNWIIDGVDQEPEDRLFREATRTPSPSTSELEVDMLDDPDNFSDDPDGDGDSEGTGGVPHSSINRRTKAVPPARSNRNSRARALHASNVQSGGSDVPQSFHIFNYGGGPPPPAPPSAPPRPPQVTSRSPVSTGTSTKLPAVTEGSSGGSTAPTVVHRRSHAFPQRQRGGGNSSEPSHEGTPTTAATPGSLPTPSRAPFLVTPISSSNPRAQAAPPSALSGDSSTPANAGTRQIPGAYPNGDEGCGRTDLPNGTPPQSSGNPHMGNLEEQCHDDNATHGNRETDRRPDGTRGPEQGDPRVDQDGDATPEALHPPTPPATTVKALVMAKGAVCIDACDKRRDAGVSTEGPSTAAAMKSPFTEEASKANNSLSHAQQVSREATKATAAPGKPASPLNTFAGGPQRLPPAEANHSDENGFHSTHSSITEGECGLHGGLLPHSHPTYETRPRPDSSFSALLEDLRTYPSLCLSYLLRLATPLLLLVAPDVRNTSDGAVLFLAALFVEGLLGLLLFWSSLHPRVNALRRGLEQCRWRGFCRAWRETSVDAGTATDGEDAFYNDRRCASRQPLLPRRRDLSGPTVHGATHDSESGGGANPLTPRTSPRRTGTSCTFVCVCSAVGRQMAATTLKYCVIVAFSFVVAALIPQRSYTMSITMGRIFRYPENLVPVLVACATNVLRGMQDELNLGGVPVRRVSSG